MTLERFDGVGRATRIITARRGKQGTERDLVRAHHQDEQRSHQESLDPESAGASGAVDRGGLLACQASSCPSTRSISAPSAEKATRYASGRIRITMSAGTSLGRRRVLDSSRRRRFTRLRATADWRKRGTISPIRVLVPSGSTRGEATTRTSSNAVRIRFPSCAIRCSSAPRVMRARRGNPSDARGVFRLRRTCPGCGPSTASGPSCGGEPGSYDPISFPYAHGTRAFSDAAYCAEVRLAFPWLLQMRSELTKAQTGKVSFYREIGQAK